LIGVVGVDEKEEEKLLLAVAVFKKESARSTMKGPVGSPL